MKKLTLVCNLPDGEGTVLTENASEFQVQQLEKFTIESFFLLHGNYEFEKPYLGRCGGGFKIITVSEKKRVLVCDRCRLRIELPRNTLSIMHLREACEAKQGWPSTV
jgi:hypothetical protein